MSEYALDVVPNAVPNTVPNAVPDAVPKTLQVLLPLPLPAFDFLPPHGQLTPCPGQRIVVPWQQGVRQGIVLATRPRRAQETLELREAIATLEPWPWLSAAALQTVVATAQHSCAPAGLVLANLLAVGLNEPLHHEVRALAGTDLPLGATDWTAAAGLRPQVLELYRRQALIEERVLLPRPQVRVLAAVRDADEGLAAAAQHNQRQALAVLQRGALESAAALSRLAGVPESAVRTLIRKGYAAYRDQDAPPVPLPDIAAVCSIGCTPVALHWPPLSQLALSGGRRAERVAALIPLLQSDLEHGQSTLLLAPEQAILHETAALLASALPLRVLSGELSDKQRLRVWRELAQGEPAILLGSYLALLAPLANLGRVVVLEEGNHAYKLPSGCRAWLPGVAKRLAEASDAAFMTTDALTSPERLHALAPEALLQLKTPSPRVHRVDLATSHNWPLSADLIKLLRQVKERHRQAILLAPRRGFSAALGCTDCGWTAQCPNCDLPLRYHQKRHLLRCHQCGYSAAAPDTCPGCAGHGVSPTRAAGTEWIVAAVQRLLAPFPVKRFDSDLRDDLGELMLGRPGVLVATTAILRHPPLPHVSLVAVTLLDSQLNVGDFRADEDAYRYLLNLAELAPGQRPLTLLQTFQPANAAVEAFMAHSDRATQTFLETLLGRRARFRYPPYGVLAKVQLSAKQVASAERAAGFVAAAIRTAGATEEELLGPAVAPVARVRGEHCYHLFLRADSETRLQTLLQPAREYRGGGRLRIDVDPRELSHFVE